jgi:flagellar P-ring protein precursor FlgI
MHSILGSSSPVLRKTTLRLTDDRFLSSAGRRQPAACRLWSSHKLLLAAFLAFPLLPGLYSQTRLKDLITLEGMRDNQLVGYGLVVGLAGTGDKQTTVFSTQSLANMLQQMGVTVNPTVITVKNTAAVMVTATLPAFAQPGTHIDVTASAIGDAANLQGGTLILTSLRGANGQVYATAQGSVVTGGFAAGRGGNSQTVNHPTVGRVPNGATVERAAPSLAPSLKVDLQLRQSDFTTAARIAKAINEKFPNQAHAENSALVTVLIPDDYLHRTIEFISELEKIPVDADQAAKVVINERTGTIVMGKDIRIKPTAIFHGNLIVQVETTFALPPPPQPSGVAPPGSQPSGKPDLVPQTKLSANEEKGHNVILKDGATVEELVRALTAIGSTARDVIAILENLRAAGALDAELEVI